MLYLTAATPRLTKSVQKVSTLSHSLNGPLHGDLLSFTAESSTLRGYKSLAYEKCCYFMGYIYILYGRIKFQTKTCSLLGGDELHAPNVWCQNIKAMGAMVRARDAVTE